MLCTSGPTLSSLITLFLLTSNHTEIPTSENTKVVLFPLHWKRTDCSTYLSHSSLHLSSPLIRFWKKRLRKNVCTKQSAFSLSLETEGSNSCRRFRVSGFACGFWLPFPATLPYIPRYAAMAGECHILASAGTRPNPGCGALSLEVISKSEA